jgi:hypothetical protein
MRQDTKEIIMTEAPNTRPVSLVDKIDWLLNEQNLANRQVELQGTGGFWSAAERLREAHRRAFEMLPEFRAALQSAAKGADERALIVAWLKRDLRSEAAKLCGYIPKWQEQLWRAADAIERGKHLNQGGDRG